MVTLSTQYTTNQQLVFKNNIPKRGGGGVVTPITPPPPLDPALESFLVVPARKSVR